MQKTNVMRLLEKAHIPFQFYEYDVKQGVDAVAVAHYLNKPTEQIFKTLVTITPQHNCIVCVVPASSELNLKKAAELAQVKSLEMLALKKLLATTGYVHGGCSPIGMKKQFETWIDASALQFRTICISGGKVGITIEMNPQHLGQLTGAKFGSLGG